MAKLRPKVPIVAICENVHVARQLALVWGVYPIIVPPHLGDFNLAIEIDKSCKLICEAGFANPLTDLITVTAGLPWGSAGTTNVIRVTAAAGTNYWFNEKNKLQQYGKMDL